MTRTAEQVAAFCLFVLGSSSGDLAVKSCSWDRRRRSFLWRSRGLLRVLQELPIRVEPLLVEKAKVLDNFYVGTRYPDGHPEGPPFEHYGEIQSQDAIEYASEILAFVRAQVA